MTRLGLTEWQLLTDGVLAILAIAELIFYVARSEGTALALVCLFAAALVASVWLQLDTNRMRRKREHGA